MFDSILRAAIDKCGTSSVLADEIGVSPSELSKFCAGTTGFKTIHLEKLFKISGLVVTSEKEKEGLINAALTFAELYKGKN